MALSIMFGHIIYFKLIYCASNKIEIKYLLKIEIFCGFLNLSLSYGIKIIPNFMLKGKIELRDGENIL